MFRIHDLRDLFGASSSVVIITDEWNREIAIPQISISRLALGDQSIAEESFRQVQKAIIDHASKYRPPKYPFRIIFNDGCEDDETLPSIRLTVPEWFSTWAQSCGIEIRYLSDLKFLDGKDTERRPFHESK